jgi:hypothetical protein
MDVEKAIRVGLGQRESPEVRITETDDTFVVSIVVAGNTWTSRKLSADDWELERLEFEIVRPLQQWAKAGFPDREPDLPHRTRAPVLY